MYLYEQIPWRLAMNIDWLQDGRKIPDNVMLYIRVMAVYAVRELGQSPEDVIKVLNFNRACMYRWLRLYDEGGYAALESDMPVGAEPMITSELDEWLKKTILEKTPIDFGYDTNLWTCKILAELLEKEFYVTVSDSTVRLHLKNMGLTSQKPEYQDATRDEHEIEYFLNKKFPRIQCLANKIGADIGFQDESGVGIMTRYGKTWGLCGKTPIIKVSMKRGGFNVISMVTTNGQMRYSVKDENIDGEIFIDFLKQLLHNREHPLILLVDHATFHSSKPVRDFVRAHRSKLRIYFLPKRVPEMNPDEQVWNEIKVNHIGKQPVKDKKDLKKRLYSVLAGLQKNTKRIFSFFALPDTEYAMQPVPNES
jgi:transposase